MSPSLKVAIFWSKLFLTTQKRPVLDRFRRLTDRVQGLGSSPGIPLYSRFLERPLLSQVIFRTSVAPVALHSTVILHQLSIRDSDLVKIWGRSKGSGKGGKKRMEPQSVKI
jgi:hypothetical protein